MQAGAVLSPCTLMSMAPTTMFSHLQVFERIFLAFQDPFCGFSGQGARVVAQMGDDKPFLS